MKTGGRVWPQDPWRSSACADPASESYLGGSRMAVHECLALHPSSLLQWRAGSVGIPPGSQQLGAAGPAGDQQSQGGVAGEACSFHHEHKRLGLPWCLARAPTVHFLIAAAGSASQRSGSRGDPDSRHLLTPCCSRPAPMGVLLALRVGGEQSPRSWTLQPPVSATPNFPSLSPPSGATIIRLTLKTASASTV